MGFFPVMDKAIAEGGSFAGGVQGLIQNCFTSSENALFNTHYKCNQFSSREQLKCFPVLLFYLIRAQTAHLSVYSHIHFFYAKFLCNCRRVW